MALTLDGCGPDLNAVAKSFDRQLEIERQENPLITMNVCVAPPNCRMKKSTNSGTALYAENDGSRLHCDFKSEVESENHYLKDGLDNQMIPGYMAAVQAKLEQLGFCKAEQRTYFKFLCNIEYVYLRNCAAKTMMPGFRSRGSVPYSYERTWQNWAAFGSMTTDDIYRLEALNPKSL